MKGNRLFKKLLMFVIAAILMVPAQFMTAKAESLSPLENPKTVYGFLKTIRENYGGEITTLTYYGEYDMYITDGGSFGSGTSYYLRAEGPHERFYELAEDGIQSIEFVVRTEELLNDPEEDMMNLIELTIAQAEENLFTEEDALVLQEFLSKDQIIARTKRLIELGNNPRLVSELGPRWGAEIIRRENADLPVGDKICIHLFRLSRSIKFTPEEPVVSVGETMKLKYEIENLIPGSKTKKLTWLSNDDSVLTVDQNGTIRGISKGEAVVSVPVVDNGTPAFAKVTVRVVEGVKKIVMGEKKLDLLLCNDEEKGKARLTYTCEPADADDPTVTWTSSNEKVATVDEFGNVQAVGAGTAKITATSNGPQNHQKPASAVCNVTVKQGVTEISLSEQSLTLATGKRGRLKVSYLPQNAANKKAVWTSSDETVAKVDKNGNITAVSKGSAVITCTVADDSSVSAACTVNVMD